MGGQQRKLSVAIALCGNSKFVVLDEPTASIDTASRHHLWDVIKSLKKGKVVLLVTHYLDEADALSDRIMIMHAGKIAAFGSSMFLKQFCQVRRF